MQLVAFVIALVAVGLLTFVGNVLAEISKTLRRIEARLALYRPLENEDGPLAEFEVRDRVKKRATQHDIWRHLRIRDRMALGKKNLSAKDWARERRELREYQESVENESRD